MKQGDERPRRVIAKASPSLALIKYWGKDDEALNTPATPSLAVTLDGLFSITRVSPGDTDSVTLDGKPVDIDRYRRFFSGLRRELATEMHFEVQSSNTFPTAAGLASSASGFAALTVACAELCGATPSVETVSMISRIGSASAARSVYGGFTALPAGALSAQPLYDRTHWPDFRIIVVSVTSGKKSISSREAMSRAKDTSPYYGTWTSVAADRFERAVNAVGERDLESLGPLMRTSYLEMFSTMFTSNPPVIYWLPDSLEVIRLCEDLRHSGIHAYETMDAGPQVKIACELRDADTVVSALREINREWGIIVAAPGDAPRIEEA